MLKIITEKPDFIITSDGTEIRHYIVKDFMPGIRDNDKRAYNIKNAFKVFDDNNNDDEYYILLSEGEPYLVCKCKYLNGEEAKIFLNYPGNMDGCYILTKYYYNNAFFNNDKVIVNGKYGVYVLSNYNIDAQSYDYADRIIISDVKGLDDVVKFDNLDTETKVYLNTTYGLSIKFLEDIENIIKRDVV